MSMIFTHVCGAPQAVLLHQDSWALGPDDSRPWTIPRGGWGSCRPTASGTPPQGARTRDVPTCCQEHLWSNAHLPGCITPVASVAEHRCPERWSRSKLPRSASVQSPSCYPFRFTGANIFTVKRYPIILSVCIPLITCENMHLFRGPLELWGFLSA